MTDGFVTLAFDNRDNGEVISMRVERAAVRHIMDWYGAFCAGDDYDVFINGRKQAMGINGEYEPVVIDL
jgi:predicted transcriptional regulator